MYKDDYISAFGKLAPSEAWKAETLAKMRALEKRREDGRAGLDGVLAADEMKAAVKKAGSSVKKDIQAEAKHKSRFNTHMPISQSTKEFGG